MRTLEDDIRDFLLCFVAVAVMAGAMSARQCPEEHKLETVAQLTLAE